VLAHDLADDPGGIEAREAGEVDGGLGLAGALEHAPASRAEREDVPGLDEVGGPFARIDGDLNGARAVRRRDPRRDPFTRLDGDRERGAERRLVVVGHLAERELLAALLGQAQADEPPAVRGHEVDRVWSRELRGDREVALVLAVRRVDDHDELALADVFEGGFNGCERGGFDLHWQIVTLRYLTSPRLAPRPRGGCRYAAPRRPARRPRR